MRFFWKALMMSFKSATVVGKQESLFACLRHYETIWIRGFPDILALWAAR